jgi:predicted polyphosphate/ATP-dependent NAD kinase
MGGPVGLKGSDGAAVQARARRLGGVSHAGRRAVEALHAMTSTAAEIVTVGGEMGEAACWELRLPHEVVARFGHETDGRDTTAGVSALIAAGATLILFAGGDGAARDVAQASGTTPILGVPAGVKMYSGVFAATPPLAGKLAERFLATAPDRRRIEEVEILDADEESLRGDHPALRIYGSAWVPASPAVQRAKASLPLDEDREIEALCRGIAARADPDCLYIVGPGRTMRLFMAACGLPKTLLGVDAMLGGRLVGRDCNEAELLALLDGRSAQIVVGLLGAQGGLFGRGNQQISPRVLRWVGLERILILASVSKVASLPRGLFVDTGDADLDSRFEAFVRIHTGPRRSALLRLRAPTI